ncbi:MAG: universal stress protein [Planctomycetes bacterium]|nr:universal stress protein [Planctomycetota bacterium]
MEPYEKILVPVHFSSDESPGTITRDSQDALEQARVLAGELGGQLTLAHVFAGLDHVGDSSDDGDLPAIEQALDAWIAAAAEQAVRADRELLFGAPADEIVRCAETEGFDLVLMGTRRKRGRGGSLVGSTAARVILQSTVPVWVAKHHGIQHRKVVVGTDLGDGCDPVIAHALHLAHWRGAELHVVHACDHALASGPDSVPALEQELRERRIRLEAQMARVLEAERSSPRYVAHVAFGSPESILWTVARTVAADVAVVGFTGRTATERLCRGNTAEQVLSELPCSLLTVRP